MKAAVVEGRRELERSGKGALLVTRFENGAPATLVHRCPGCGEIGGLRVAASPSHVEHWSLTGWPDAPTLSPSIHHAEPHCGWHGWLRAGEWVSM
jgi:hypothetical protein